MTKQSALFWLSVQPVQTTLAFLAMEEPELFAQVAQKAKTQLAT